MAKHTATFEFEYDGDLTPLQAAESIFMAAEIRLLVQQTEAVKHAIDYGGDPENELITSLQRKIKMIEAAEKTLVVMSSPR